MILPSLTFSFYFLFLFKFFSLDLTLNYFGCCLKKSNLYSTNKCEDSTECALVKSLRKIPAKEFYILSKCIIFETKIKFFQMSTLKDIVLNSKHRKDLHYSEFIFTIFIIWEKFQQSIA